MRRHRFSCPSVYILPLHLNEHYPDIYWIYNISSGFQVSRFFRYSFDIFFFHLWCLIVSTYNITRYLKCSFFLSVLILSWFGSSISFYNFSLSTLHYYHVFLFAKFHSYILTGYFYFCISHHVFYTDWYRSYN